MFRLIIAPATLLSIARPEQRLVIVTAGIEEGEGRDRSQLGLGSTGRDDFGWLPPVSRVVALYGGAPL
jgi:hypothetical protein